MRHVIIPDHDPDIEADYGASYHHAAVSDRPGALYRWLCLNCDSTAHDYRADLNEALAAAPTYSAKRRVLDEWAELDITEGLEGQVLDAAGWREMNDGPDDDGPPDNLGHAYSRLDPTGVYLGDGTKIGSTCRCEDYPCCGH